MTATILLSYYDLLIVGLAIGGLVLLLWPDKR